MKKLITLLLILALALPALALADDEKEPYSIVKHFALHIDSHAGDTMTVTGASIYEFDSLTIDLFMASDNKTCYVLQTECSSGFFFNSGMKKYTIYEYSDKLRIADGAGNYLSLQRGETEDELWIDFGYGYFVRMQLVNHMNILTDIQ